MSISPLSIGSRAMTANYAALQTTGNNIANANTAGYSRQTRRAGDGVRPVHRRRLLRQGRRRRHGDARAQRLPDPRGGDHRVARRRRRGAQRASCSSSRRVPDRRGRPRLRRAADVQRLRRRRQQAAGRLGAPGRAGRASATSPRAFATPRDQLDRLQAGVTPDLRTSVDVDQRADDADRRPQPQIASVQGTGHAAERPARPARHGDRRPVARSSR